MGYGPTTKGFSSITVLRYYIIIVTEIELELLLDPYEYRNRQYHSSVTKSSRKI